MRHLLLLLILPSALLWQSCMSSGFKKSLESTATKTDAIAGDVGVVTKALSEFIKHLKPPASGVPGNEGGTTQGWITAIGGVLMTGYAAWQQIRAKTATRALTATVDAGETLPPEAREAYKAAAASSTHMGAAETALIATLKAR